ncbi:citrate transporter [Oscillospiraceae bacterium PP1C4]
MNTAIGIILLITYVVFAIYAAKGGNLMLGFFVMAVLWAGLGALAGVTAWNATAEGMIDINKGIFEQGPELWGATAAIIIFGSWFGRIMVETGIARTIIRKAVELGGDRPAVTCILLSVVTSLIFTSAYGAGAVVAIGVIVFPIMLSLGIPKPLATASFLMSVGAGLYFNMGWFKQVSALVPGFEYDRKYQIFAAIAFGVQMAATIIMILVHMNKTGVSHAWAAQAVSSDTQTKKISGLALLTPVLPVALAIVLGFQPITAILVSVLWALFFTGNLKKWDNLGTLVQKTFYDGVADVGLVFAFLFFLQMFLRAAKVCAPLLAPIIQPIMPSTLLPLFLIFGLLAVLGLFRGPLTVWGAGAATLAMFQSLGTLSASVLFPLFLVPTTTINGSICPTQSWCLWAIGYNKVGIKEYFKVVLAYALVASFVLEIVAYFMFAL